MVGVMGRGGLTMREMRAQFTPSPSAGCKTRRTSGLYASKMSSKRSLRTRGPFGMSGAKARGPQRRPQCGRQRT